MPDGAQREHRLQRLADLEITDFLGRVASTAPTPGAGPVGAFTLAMGVACARKAIAITQKHIGPDPTFAAADVQLESVLHAACEGADRDADRFSDLIAAMRLPHTNEAERDTRQATIRAAAAAVVAVAERLIGLGDTAREVILSLKDRVDPVMAGDVNTALRLIEANRAIQSDNLAENSRLC